ncbi:MAG: insulinase family protein [Ignavibacteria bacterium]|nr:insulinase family protein [Ignavibacteria bacterium]
MKLLNLILLFILMIVLTNISEAQKKYSYQTFKNDPLGTRIYKLDNGLTVYLSINKQEPRIATRIAVKAGSKNDPGDATGLAHYLEHMLFKGTDKFGTKDFEIEGKLINEIIDLYEQHRAATDPDVRKAIYKKIDSVSYLASGYAIPNEYDKMLSSIGATGTNAYTSVEQTVYVNEIPSNQISKWIEIEAERFRQPIMRLFHTELEVVYEEKNRSMDNGFSKAYESLYAELFQKHSYGTQTTIGTVEHLKNPSLKKVIDYFGTYYVPNNMAIIMAGDFDPDLTIKLIDEGFGKLPYKEVPKFVPPAEDKISSPIERTVYSPEAENLFIGYRLNGSASDETDLMNMMTAVLYNGSAGLIDLNIMRQQKALNASSSVSEMKDYSTFVLSGSPREGQSLEELKDLLLSQIELVKKGDFPDWYPEAVTNNYRSTLTRIYQNNSSRVSAYVKSFTTEIPWDKYLGNADRYSKITKADIVNFANKNFGNNYVVVYKKTGEDKNVQKIVKPEITPVKVNRDSESKFLTNVLSESVSDVQPKFIDYKKEISESIVKPGINLYSLENSENNLFELSFIYEFGNNADKSMSTALSYLKLIGTSTKTSAEISQEFFKLGCTYNVSQNGDRTVISLSGLNDFFRPALKLLLELIYQSSPDEQAYKNLVNDILKSRANSKLSKNVILRQALMNYGTYGPSSPFTNILSESELKGMNPKTLTDLIHSLVSYQHTITYYGPFEKAQIEKELYPYYRTKDMPREVPPNKKYEELPTNENKIYFVDYNMKQVEIMFINRSGMFSLQNIPIIKLYNEYFGSGMSSIVFQDLREAKALAYSVNSNYGIPDRADKYHYLVSYIGTQSDKLGEAMNGFSELLNNIPSSEITFNSAKDGVLKNIQTERITRNDIIRSFLSNKKLGIDYDLRKDIYNNVMNYTLDDVKKFNENYVKGKPYTYLLIGDKKKIDFELLGKYGKVETLTLEQIFGY